MPAVVNCGQKGISCQISYIDNSQEDNQELFAHGYLRRVSVPTTVANMATIDTAVVMAPFGDIIIKHYGDRWDKAKAESLLGLAAKKLSDQRVRRCCDQGFEALIHGESFRIREAVRGNVEDHVV